MMKNSDCLNTCIAVMKYTGVWLPDGLKNRNQILCYKLFGFIIQTLTFVLIVTAEIAYVLLAMGDTQRTIDAAVLLMSHLVQGVKVLTICFRQHRIKKLIVFIDGPNFTRQDPAKRKMLEDTINLVSLAGKAIISSAGITSFFWCLVPTLRDDLTLPLRTAYPFDISGKVIFSLMYIYNSVSVALVGVGDAAENYLVAGLTMLAGMQLQLLHMELIQAGQSGDYGEIVKCVQFHQNIIKYVDELSSIFSIALLCQFITSSITVCMTLYMITVLKQPLEIMTLFFYLFCVFLELLMYCYPGELLINKSLLASDAAYPDNWSGDIRGRRALLMTALRAQRALTISAGGMFRVSLPTAATVIQTAYSYYAVLRQKIGT